MGNKFKNFKKIGIIILSIILLSNTVVFAEVGIEDDVSAYLLGDYETGEILEEYNIEDQIEVASITKLMTYLIIMDENSNGSISMDDLVYIDEDATKIKGSTLMLREGEVFELIQLLEALMVISANDGTYALAKHVGGTEESFVDMMNKKAKEIGLENTKYVNSTGLPEGRDTGLPEDKDENQNIMSSKDIFTLSKYIIENYPEIIELATLPYIEVEYREKMLNSNPLLNEVEGIDGLKTGYTGKAGYCLVSTMMVKELENSRMIYIVMGTEDKPKRKEAAEKLIKYGLDNYSNEILLSREESVGIINHPKSREKDVEVYPVEDFAAIAKEEDSIETKIILDEDLEFPLQEFDKIGKVLLFKNNKVIKEMDVEVHMDLKKQNIFHTIYDKIIEWTYSLLTRIIE